MASTYVNNLRLNEMGTGDASGTWGTTTNTNLELIGEALGFGTEAITTNADTHSTVVADGASDAGRAMYLKYTGTLDSACTITITPNTMKRMQFIENGTSGSQNIIISQGSGANITIPPGDTKAVYLDGAGSGAAVVDAFASLNVVDLKVQDDLTVTDDLIVNGDIDLEGAIDVNGTANLDVVDIDGAVDMASTLTVAGVVDITDTTDSSDATGDTGALRTEGGASIAKKLYVGTDLDVDGTANLDIVDIDGAVQIDAAVTVGADDQGYDFKFFGDTASAYMMWDTSVDDLVFAGAAGIDLDGDIDVNGTANLDNTDIDGTLAVDGTTISLDATTSFNIDNSNTSNGITIGTATSGVPISIGHTTSETTVNDNLVVTGDIDLEGSIDVNGTANLDVVDIDGAVNMAADLTTTADIKIDSDTKGLVLGADQDVTLYSDDTGTAYLVRGTDVSPHPSDTEGWIKFFIGDSGGSYLSLYGGEGGDAEIYLEADGGDDNADVWRMTAGANGDFKIASKSTGSYVDLISSTGAGAIIMAKQPAFMATPSSGQANISTGSSTVAFGSERFDQGSNFASNTFTAPRTGKYQFNLVMRTDNIDSASNYLSTQLVTSNITYQDIGIWDPGPGSGDWTYWTFSWSLLVDMDTNDTAYVQITQSAGAAQVDIDVTSYFSGFLAC